MVEKIAIACRLQQVVVVGKKHRYDAYTAKVFGKTGKLWEYLSTGVMPEKASYPWQDEWT